MFVFHFEFAGFYSDTDWDDGNDDNNIIMIFDCVL